jgi:hypothetical protein
MAKGKQPGVSAKQRTFKRIVPLPDCIQVGPHIIPIERNPAPQEQEMYGYFEQNEAGATICMIPTLEEARELTVFFHEVLHAISETYGLALKHSQVYGCSEGLTQALAPWLSQLYHHTCTPTGKK